MDRAALVEELARLYDLTLRLRQECPWDRKQTQQTIIAYTLEETYELADAIAQRAEGGEAAVRGELGDLLFQVYFLACVAEEEGLYNLGDVAAGIQAKLIRRHPHIFGEAVADTPEQVRATWEVIKREAEGREGIFCSSGRRPWVSTGNTRARSWPRSERRPRRSNRSWPGGRPASRARTRTLFRPKWAICSSRWSILRVN
jgi:NTP pyrophosphatase (non-canonical NTP hydrolase)